jgi:hypothetical protein
MQFSLHLCVDTPSFGWYYVFGRVVRLRDGVDATTHARRLVDALDGVSRHSAQWAIQDADVKKALCEALTSSADLLEQVDLFVPAGTSIPFPLLSPSCRFSFSPWAHAKHHTPAPSRCMGRQYQRKIPVGARKQQAAWVRGATSCRGCVRQVGVGVGLRIQVGGRPAPAGFLRNRVSPAGVAPGRKTRVPEEAVRDGTACCARVCFLVVSIVCARFNYRQVGIKFADAGKKHADRRLEAEMGYLWLLRHLPSTRDFVPYLYGAVAQVHPPPEEHVPSLACAMELLVPLKDVARTVAREGDPASIGHFFARARAGIGAAVAAVNKAGVLHGDVKLDNFGVRRIGELCCWCWCCFCCCCCLLVVCCWHALEIFA